MAIGSALFGYHNILNQPRAAKGQIFSPYLGKEYSEDSIEAELNKYCDRLHVEKLENVVETTARLISEGNIIGWFQGRSEIGPRALGNRSILADPRRAEMKDIINSRIKHREAFRPFAPIVLEEQQEQYFFMRHPSYYMMFVPYIEPDKRKQIPAVTHVDGTGRLQTVSKQLNPKLHNLLTAFYDRTGVPVLLNTSFNDNGEPIIESPSDAIRCFLNIDLDYLVIHDFIVSKRKASVS
ncbi:carbamoyltransferase C-terminal domain-containing protein [Cohnella faecalis]|nr:carbamoyltransferase C-terminal domain-containing protein [Cohnella faecalis]